MTKKELKEIINADLYRYYGNISLKSFLKGILEYPGFRYTYLLRKCNFCKNNKSIIRLIFFRILLGRYRIKYGFDIGYSSNIGKGLYLGHFGGVVINPEVFIGCNVNIGHGVTIGQINRGKNKGIPHIGNRVWMGAHAIVVGNIRIGDDVLIGPGAYVNFDVPQNAVVIGNPGKIVSYDGIDSYITRTIA